MNIGKWFGVVFASAILAFAIPGASAAPKKPETPLTKAGEALMANYAARLDALKAEIRAALPKTDQAKAKAFMEGYEPEGEIPAAAKAILADLKRFLSSSRLDAKLIRGAILANATPAGLARFAQRGKAEKALVEKLLAADEMMMQMLVNGGPALGGKYGEAMQAYEAIQKASPRAAKGFFQRLALGISLAREDRGVPTAFDPVNRYLAYEKAYLDGELDPLFNTLTAWEYEKVVNSDATDEDLAWGRKMLRTYRPDHIFQKDYGWRYVKIVQTDVAYKTPENLDREKFAGYQRHICAGGKCGPRAFFGRFVLRSFGIPTWGATQRGHAALGHWTPSGWTTCFGAHWRHNFWGSQSGLDFLLDSQARESPKDYLKALRAQWIGNVLGEARADVQRNAKPANFWGMMAIFQKKQIVAEAKPEEVALTGEDLAEANVSAKAEEIMRAEVSPADRKISVKNGTIIIPAVATSSPTQNTGKILFMKSFDGGMQLHHNRLGSNEPKDSDFEYVVDVPAAGTYALVARVAVVNLNQQLTLAVNGAAKPVEIALPYSRGLWQDIARIPVKLVRGKNTLHFSRKAPHFGLSIKQFTLTPAR